MEGLKKLPKFNTGIIEVYIKIVLQKYSILNNQDFQVLDEIKQFGSNNCIDKLLKFSERF